MTNTGMSRMKSRMRRLVFERGAHAALFQHRDDLLRDAAGQIDAAARHEHQRQITGKTAEIGGKQIERFCGARIGAVKRRCGDLLRLRQCSRHSIGLADGTVEIDQAAPAQDLLAGNAAAKFLDVRENLIVARIARSHVDMAALAGHRIP